MDLSNKSTVMEPPPETLLSVGDIVGMGVRTARRKWRFLLHMYLSAAILYGLGVTALTWAIGRFPSLMRTSDLSYIMFSGALAALATVAGLGTAWLLAQRTVAVNRMLLLGVAEHSARAYAKAHQWKAFSIYFGSTMIGILIIGAAAGALFFTWTFLPKPAQIPISILMIPLVAILQIWLYQFWSISLAVLSVEETHWWTIASRSYELAKSSRSRAFAYVLLLGVALYMLNVILNVPLLVVFLVDFILKTSTIVSTEMPIWLRILDAFLSFLRLVILTPCAVLCNAFYYNDLRLRNDGWDLVKRLDILSQLEKQ